MPKKPKKARVEESDVKEQMTELLLIYGRLPTFKQRDQPDYACANLKTQQWLQGGGHAVEWKDAAWRSRTGLKQSLRLARKLYEPQPDQSPAYPGRYDALKNGLPTSYVVCRRDLDESLTWMPVDVFLEREG